MAGGIVYQYTLVDSDGSESGPYDNYQEAVREAGSSEAVMEYTFEYSERRFVHAPHGATQWIVPESDGEMQHVDR